jgi:threonine dehydrogenase-like Zn-dependent dehydrogenase
MKAVVWRGERRLEIETVEDARLEAPTDVLLRLTSTAICGTGHRPRTLRRRRSGRLGRGLHPHRGSGGGAHAHLLWLLL